MTVTTIISVTAQQQDSVQTEEEGRNYSARTQSGGGSAWQVRRRCSLLSGRPSCHHCMSIVSCCLPVEILRRKNGTDVKMNGEKQL